MFLNSKIAPRGRFANGLIGHGLLATAGVVSLVVLLTWSFGAAVDTGATATARARRIGALCWNPGAFKTAGLRDNFLNALYRKLGISAGEAHIDDAHSGKIVAASSSLVAQTHLDGACVPQFAVSMPVFGPAGSISRVDAAKHPKLTVTMKEIDQDALPVGMQSLPNGGTVDDCPDPPITFAKTRVWAYETSDTKTGKVLGTANWPAVTIEARRGIPNRITYVNNLPSFNPSNPTGPGLVQGLLDIDQTIHWADPLGAGCGMPINCTDDPTNYCCQAYTGPEPVAVHLHGAEGSACYDGTANQWFTPDGRIGPLYCTDGHPGAGKDIYTYDNSQEPGTLWFHDHALGATGENVRAGLAGFYFLRDPKREPKNLPSGPYEIEMALQDRIFDTNSQLMSIVPATPKYHPFWFVRFLGDVITVNGAAWPYLKVEPRRYRFRILDGANGRRFDLHFGGAPVYQIGADDNYFDKPLLVNDTACAGEPDSTSECSDASLLPGQRADVIIDFTKLAGKTITVTNSASLDAGPPDVMQFQVTLPLNGIDKSCDPANPDPVHGICARPIPVVRLTDGKGNLAPGVKIDKVRELLLNEINTGTPNGFIEEYVNNTKWSGLNSPSIREDFPSDGISELPQVGSTELWEIINFENTPAAYHPFHIHLVQFQILNRQAFDYKDYEEEWSSEFGNGPAPLPNSCTRGEFCEGYGPPLDYLTLNGDGALGGNPAVGPYLHDSEGNPTPIIPPDPGESGWTDDAKQFPHQVLRLVVRWTPSDVPVKPNKSYAGRNFYSFDPTKGQYVFHCHIAGHEDNEMMRPYRVVK